MQRLPVTNTPSIKLRRHLMLFRPLAEKTIAIGKELRLKKQRIRRL